jgi:hypothetical protein
MKIVDYSELTVVPDFFIEGSFEAEFQKIYSEAFSLLVSKQHRYGNTNIDQLGLHGVISRMSFDKISRALKFMNGKVVNGKVQLDRMDEGTEESLEDTLLDIANYALIAVALQRGVWGKPLEDAIVEVQI